MAAVQVLSLTLMWFEDQVADDNMQVVLDLARQISALRTATDTEAGRRLGPILLLLRLQYRELQVMRYEAALALTLGEGRLYLAQLRAVLLSYRPGQTVPIPLAFPRASEIFDGNDIDEDAVEDVLVNDLRVSDLTRSRLMGHIPQ
jgi:hypothetical protein